MTNPLRRRPFQTRRGVTLIEAVLFISIALGLIVGGIVFYQQASLSSRISTQVRVLSAIVSEGRALYSAQSNFTSLPPLNEDPSEALVDYSGERVDSILVAAGALPTRIVRAVPRASVGRPYPSVLQNEWGGDIYVMAGQNTGGTLVLLIGLTDIPSRACARLSSTDPTGRGVFTEGITGVGFYRPRPGGRGRTGAFNNVADTDFSVGNVARNVSFCGGSIEQMDAWFTVALR